MKPAFASFSTSALLLLSHFLVAVSAFPGHKSSAPKCTKENTKVIHKDVAIVGGGSSGTYSAVRLRQAGKSVVVIEKNGLLGGHTETYTDPTTGIPVNYGVVVWLNLTTTRNYFEFLNFSYVTTGQLGGAKPPLVIDYKTGAAITTPSNMSAIEAAFINYYEAILPYSYIEDSLSLPNPVPADLSMPFIDFLTKYNAVGALQTIYQYNEGFGNIEQQSALQQIAAFGPSIIQSLQTGFLIGAQGNNHILYNLAADYLGSDVLYNSTICSVHRPECDDVSILVSASSQGCVEIKAKKLLLTLEPTLPNLSFIRDLSEKAKTLLGKLTYTYYYTTVLRNSGIPVNDSINVFSTSDPYGIPQMPAPYLFEPTGVDGLNTAKTGAVAPQTEEQVLQEITTLLDKASQNGVIPSPPPKPEFAAFSAHVPFGLHPSLEDLAEGYYDQLYSLQGENNTYWTGAAWLTHNSALLWNFTEAHILPNLLK